MKEFNFINEFLINRNRVMDFFNHYLANKKLYFSFIKIENVLYINVYKTSIIDGTICCVFDVQY